MAAPPELSIVRSGNGAPRFCLGGELLPPLVPGQKRPAAEVRALMAATAGLAFFGQMRAELRGDWRQAHAELCAQMEPVLCESDQLLFEGVHGLRRPLVLLPMSRSRASSYLSNRKPRVLPTKKRCTIG